MITQKINGIIQTYNTLLARLEEFNEEFSTYNTFLTKLEDSSVELANDQDKLESQVLRDGDEDEVEDEIIEDYISQIVVALENKQYLNLLPENFTGKLNKNNPQLLDIFNNNKKVTTINVTYPFEPFSLIAEMNIFFTKVKSSEGNIKIEEKGKLPAKSKSSIEIKKGK